MIKNGITTFKNEYLTGLKEIYNPWALKFS